MIPRSVGSQLLIAAVVHLVFLLVGRSVDAQVPGIHTQIEPLIGGLQSTDDIVALPGGEFAITRPVGLRTVDRFDPTTGTIAPLDAGPVVALGMTLGPSGTDLYYGDDIADVVYRLDLSTPVPSRSVFAAGFTTPVDLLFESASRLWVVDHVSGAFPNGPCTLFRVDIVAGVAQSPVPILAGIPGVADIEFDASGAYLFITSYASFDIRVLEVATGNVSLFNFPILFTAADLARLPDGNFLITTTAFAQILLLDLTAQTLTQLVTRFSQPGFGAEDIAFDANGDALITVNAGEIWRLDLTSDLRQIGDAIPGQVVDLLLDRPALAGDAYALACSVTANVGIQIGSTLVPLDNDAVLAYSLLRPPEFIGFDGILDPNGRAFAGVALPNVVGLAGFSFHVAGIYFAIGSFPPPSGFTSGLRIVID